MVTEFHNGKKAAGRRAPFYRFPDVYVIVLPPLWDATVLGFMLINVNQGTVPMPLSYVIDVE